nr:Chain M, TbtA 16-mer peptide [Thermobispora bispora DSM 43833]5WA4_N Chain N, TbtA 16-mer peptide [Thermobispora bispora DSM 43833]5WA4_O Chain O, TbtA 16-mer peptide [Thermobispora bispora DSM 43833]5WA4_P Chain P, TbtA 16-mer peptide [Thermobispora bispora DSM 43833]5WA4_Q Chain Q, TbtA 16-mer peptide [Thermobispora bispora DSM 43833]5WA4_R Chain R, TbtA 16-mer peptide [Thermobispora bispora DSM 43833]
MDLNDLPMDVFELADS